jgi:hypothetical protein
LKQGFRRTDGSERQENDEQSCFGCGKPGHVKKRCRTTDPERYRCGQRGNVKQKCYKELSAKRTNFGFKTTMSFTVLGEDELSKWIIGSGSVVHICNGKAKFECLELVTANEGERKFFGVVGQVKVEGWGELKLKCKQSEGEENKIRLTKVAFVPSTRVNLVSLSRLIEKGLSIQLKKSRVSAKLGRKLLLLGNTKGRPLCAR